jgi:hypothetical protein
MLNLFLVFYRSWQLRDTERFCRILKIVKLKFQLINKVIWLLRYRVLCDVKIKWNLVNNVKYVKHVW